jgi:sortase A
MLYSYQKATPENPHPGYRVPDHLKILPVIISSLGLCLIATVAWPIISYQIGVLAKDKTFSLTPKLLTPFVSDMEFASEDRTEISPQLATNIDYTKASNWFTVPKNTTFQQNNSSSEAVDSLAQNTTSFSLSIPSLGIERADVVVNGEDLSKSLVHYPGTALPGQLGSPVIFGHSTLPQLFSPTNYMSIFSTLPTIKTGEVILVNIDNVTYTYKITNTYQVKPNGVEILRQFYDKKSLKLVTCVPPGTKYRRLIVEANLVKS